MINRKELLKKREKQREEIEFLISQRGTTKNEYLLNKQIEEKKKRYNFYNNLLKNM